ncbi:unnamed protein product [Mytilus edulis]|uniref:Uncharacterized protein n=1 Tax=Mytilus edulis TaxID=6550 RepID=A0A8S3V713_MYTED|nr:unnamed protein product [Mytilus edulis]
MYRPGTDDYSYPEPVSVPTLTTSEPLTSSGAFNPRESYLHPSMTSTPIPEHCVAENNYNEKSFQNNRNSVKWREFFLKWIISIAIVTSVIGEILTMNPLHDVEGNYNVKTLSTEFEFLQDNGKDESDIRSNDVAFLTRVNGKPGMVVDGQLEGSPISWKIDTRAGRIFITEETYRKILPDNRPLLRQMETKFETANGSCLYVLGTAVMTLSFDEFCVDFPIIVGEVKSNLLGEDFIKCFRCHWDWNTSSLEINGKNIPFRKTVSIIYQV